MLKNIQVKNYILIKVYVVFTFLLFSLCMTVNCRVSAQDMPIPKADKNGDYFVRGYPYWQVVDEDSAGLNGRLSMDHPFQWYSPGCQYEKNKIYNWPVIRRFKKGTILPADLSPAGFCISMDDRRKPWVRVSIDTEPGGIICYIRANKNFVRPVKLPGTAARLTFKLVRLTDNTVIMSKPFWKSRVLQQDLKESQKYILVSSKDGWSKILTDTGQFGYVQNNEVRVDQKIVLGAAKVLKKAKMRKYPIDGHAVTGTLTPGETVFLVSAMGKEVNLSDKHIEIDDNESWIRILSNDGVYGFVNPENLEWIPLN